MSLLRAWSGAVIAGRGARPADVPPTPGLPSVRLAGTAGTLLTRSRPGRPGRQGRSRVRNLAQATSVAPSAIAKSVAAGRATPAPSTRMSRGT